MLWRASSEKDATSMAFEKCLRGFSEKFRGGSWMKARKYFGAVLSLVVPCIAAQQEKLTPAGALARCGRPVDELTGYQADHVPRLALEATKHWAPLAAVHGTRTQSELQPC